MQANKLGIGRPIEDALVPLSAHGYTIVRSEFVTSNLRLCRKSRTPDEGLLGVSTGFVVQDLEHGKALIAKIEAAIDREPVVSPNAPRAAMLSANHSKVATWVLISPEGKLAWRPAHLIPAFNGWELAPAPKGWEILATVTPGAIKEWRGGIAGGRLCVVPFKSSK